MATHPVERVLSGINKNSLDVQKDNFEKNFYTSVRKAINSIESPVKEKHVRRIIIATFQTKSGQIFWRYARGSRLDENAIVCWKFCHVLHKVLRDGYPKVIYDSCKFKGTLLDLGKMWGLLKQGYGKLIQNYCTLLVNKMEFHMRNHKFPGNLIINKADLDAIGENDVNIFFQLSCEIFDYMDEILCLQTNVFNSLDMSRSNSMTSSGQCRLAPLIMCIQDSGQLYDFTVKILFKLHSALPPSTLEGHRDRFFNQFKLLKTFYYNSSNLQYFKTLIQIPKLPDEPPNFFVQSNLSSHVTPIVVVPPEEPIESESNLLDLSFNDNDSDKADDTESLWSFQNEPKTDLQQNIIDEKERIIQRFMTRIQELEVELRQTKFEDGRQIEELKRSIAELECATAQRMEREIEGLKQELEKQKSNSETDAKISYISEKFIKMKEFYNKLRSEHIELIRNKAETDKKLVDAQKYVDELKTSKNIMENQLKGHVRNEAEIISLTTRNSELDSQTKRLKEDYNQLRNEYHSFKNDHSSLSSKVSMFSAEKTKLENEIKVLNQNMKLNCKLFITKLVKHSLQFSKNAINKEADLGFTSVNCTPQYFCLQIQTLQNSLDLFEMTQRAKQYSPDLFDSSLNYCFQLFYLTNCAKTFVQNIPNIEISDQLYSSFLKFISSNENLFQSIENDFDGSDASIFKIKEELNELTKLVDKIIPDFFQNKNLDLEALLKAEMEQMDKAIHDAVLKIENMITLAHKKDTGIKLEVNGKILDSCTSLMHAIKQLIYNSKLLQIEIASKQKGSLSMKEFYKRNYVWTEGLISAAKTVAADANLLVEIADKIINGNGKFEELMAASSAISASCAQLVLASKVKAEMSSQNLANLSKSSRTVVQETGNVIATTKHCLKLIEESDMSDFTNLSPHQAKRLEMECQVKVLELENLLEKERYKLAAIRKSHYNEANENT